MSSMEPAIKKIVDTYVRLGNRRAIEDLLMHRRRLSIDLGGRRGYDFSRPLAQIDEEIRIIADGLRQFEPPGRTQATASLIAPALPKAGLAAS
jgi:hypothetical protein